MKEGNGEFEPSVTMRVYANSIPASEYKDLRNAIDAASVQGTTTWIRNSAGAPIAAIVPRGIAEVGQAAWEENVRP